MLDFQRRAQAWARYAALIVVILLGVQALNGAVRTLRYWATIANYPGEVDFSEPIILYESNQQLAGTNIYRTDRNHQFVGAIYGPLLYQLDSAVARLEPDSYRPLRLLSIFGMLLTAAAAAVVVSTGRGSRLSSLLAPLLVLGPVAVVVFGVVAKPDALYIGLSLCGLAVARRGLSSKLVFLSVPLFVAAMFVKSSAVAAPAAVFFTLLWGQRSRALLFGAACVLLSLVLFAVFASVYGFEGFWRHFITYNVATFDWQRAFVREPAAFLAVNRWFVLAGLAAAAYTRDRLLIAYLIVACCFHLPLMGKAGAFINYWMEPSIALALLVALSAGWKSQAQVGMKYGLLHLTLFLLALNFSPSAHRKKPRMDSVRNHRNTQKGLAEIFASTRPARKRPRVFSSNPGNVVAFRSRIDLRVVDPFLFRQHILVGRNDGSLVADDLAQKRLTHVLVNGPRDFAANPVLGQRMTRNQLDLLDANYVLLRTFPGTEFSEGDVNVFVPR